MKKKKTLVIGDIVGHIVKWKGDGILILNGKPIGKIIDYDETRGIFTFKAYDARKDNAS